MIAIVVALFVAGAIGAAIYVFTEKGNPVQQKWDAASMEAEARRLRAEIDLAQARAEHAAFKAVVDRDA